MTQQIINIGSTANDGSGDPLRVAFEKINNNFTQLFATGFSTYQVTTFDNVQGQVIFEVPATMMTQATFQINSANPDTQDSQNITINASVQNDGSSVRWTGHSTLFINNPVTSYDMIVDEISGNVQVLVNPLVDATLNHLISAQVEGSSFGLGTPLAIEGSSGTVLVTQNNIPLTTETQV